MKQITDKDTLKLAILTIDKNRPEVIALINKYGIQLPSNAKTKMVDKAFISLSKISPKFREDFSKIAFESTSNFTGIDDFYNANGKNFNFTGVDDFYSATGVTSTPSKDVQNIVGASTTTTTTKKAFKDTAVGGFLSNLFTPEFTQGVLNTGLNVWSVKQIGQPSVTAQQQMDAARQSVYQSESDQNAQANKGMGVGTIILISAVAIGLIWGVVYYVKKK